MPQPQTHERHSVDWSLSGQCAIDARGRRVPIYRLPYTLWWRLGARELPRATLRKVLDQLRHRVPLRRFENRGAVSVLTAFHAIMGLQLVTLLPRASAPLSVYLFAVGAFGFSMLYLFRLSLGIRDFSPSSANPLSIVEAMLLERRCPSCAHSLEGLNPAADDCTICPECGSAWRLGAHKTPTIDDADPPNPELTSNQEHTAD